MFAFLTLQFFFNATVNKFTMSRCFILLLIISQLAKINTICGLELTSSLIKENVNQLDDVAEMGTWQLWDDKEIVYFSNQSRGRRSNYENVLFQNGSQYAMKATGENNFCRAPDGQYLPIDLFALDTCARCYHYIPDNPSFFHRNSKWNPKVVRVQSVQTAGAFYNVTFLVHNRNNLTLAVDSEDNDSQLHMSFIDLKSQDKWKSCCKAAVDCCNQMLGFTESSDVANQNQNINLLDRQMYSAANETSSMSKYCPPTWDGWTCWPQTSPNQVALAQCPHFIYFETEPPACARNAEKVCTFDGTWYRRGETGASTEKTNYSPCSPVGTFKQRAHVHLYAYAVSVATLLPAIFIFYSYKQLNVYRIRLHKNMFISILLNSILVIVFKVFMILPQIATSGKKDSYINQNALVCRLMLITVKYLRLTNYAWMFCEGFYLHRLIAAAFAEQSSFSVFYVIGWVLPLFPTGIYAIIRSIWYDSRCWIEPIETWEWVLNTPCLFSLVVNLIFLVNIIRILVMKLRSTNTAEPSQYRKAVRATLVLVPLFGLHFVVTIYRPSKDGCDWMEFYHYANALLDGLQGFLVAIIFCYGNGEVHYLLKRSYRRFKEQRCLRTTRNNTRRRTERGQEEEEGGAEGIGCSVFLGRSNFSTTHFSLADCSPNPHQKPLMTTSGRSSVSDERHFLNEADSTVNVVRNILPEPSGHDNLLNSHLKEYNRQEMYKLNLKNPHVRETCLDNDN